MITVPDHAWLTRPCGIGEESALVRLGDIAGFLDQRPPAESWAQRLIRHCQCCGERPAEIDYREIVRCAKHVGRNPCLIEGCGRTFKAQGNASGFRYANDHIICGKHWRALVPPGSPERCVLQRINRLAKRIGWTESLADREARIWRRIIAVAQARAAGNIDETEIKRLFGWE